MTSQAAGQRAGETTERDPESARAPARVVYESGIPPSGETWRAEAAAAGFDERLQLALAESAGLEMKLRLLVRGLKQLADAASHVEQTHGSLVNELSELRGLVPRSRTDDPALGKRVDELEQTLERTRSRAAQERSSLIREQEAFLSRLLTDHEQEVGELKRLLSSASDAADDSRAELDDGQSVAIVGRDELPSAECLEVHWEELEDTAARSILGASDMRAPRVPRPDPSCAPAARAAAPAARSSGPPPLPDQVATTSGASKRTS
jgi:hypothetical protein